jgi:hypothetical protein
MTDTPIDLAETGSEKPIVGRSLWKDAWLRLRRNKAAVASACVLILVALAGIFGPMISPHPYDRVYPQYVRAPASLEAYPREEAIIPAFERAVARTRSTSARSMSRARWCACPYPPTTRSIRASCATSTAPISSPTRASRT